MRRILITCNTHYQLILAILLRRSLFAEDVVAVVVSDQSNDSRKYSSLAKKTGIFSDVFFVENKQLCIKSENKIATLKSFFYMLRGNMDIYNSISDNVYDELIFYNPDTATHALFDDLYRQNSNITVSRYEEGILSYFNEFSPYPKRELSYKIRGLLGKKNLMERVEKYYCTIPELIMTDVIKVKIPPVFQEDDTLKKDIAEVFDVNIGRLEYKEKYIYFAGVFDFEGEKPAGEIGLIRRIAELVGKENLLVKVHPRYSAERYEKEGLKVDCNSTAPWEAIQLNYDFSNHVFMTGVSGSALSVSSVVENPPRICFMYELLDRTNNALLDATANTLEKNIRNFKGNPFFGRIEVIKKIEDILD